MYKKHKAWKEVGLFVKRHIIICVLCVICFFIITKFTQIPMPEWFPQFIRSLFSCPSTGTAYYEGLSLLNNLSLAFLASIIVYIVVQYIPERRKANKAFVLLRKEFTTLYSYMSKLICMYLFELGITTSEKELTLQQLSGICEISLTDNVKKCKIIDLRNGQYSNSFSIGYSLFKDSQKNCELIEEALCSIKSTLYSSVLDSDIIDTISILENNWFLRFFMFSKPYASFNSFLNTKQHIINFDKGFFEFIKCHLTFKDYSFDKISYEFIALSDNEFEKVKEEILFLKPRQIYMTKSVDEVDKIAMEIIKLEPTEMRLRKSEGVLLEMLVYYDSESNKKTYTYILNSAIRIAKYIWNNSTTIYDRTIAYLNLAQVKKRLNSLDNSDKKILRLIKLGKRIPIEAKLGSAILCEDDKLANEFFNLLTEDKKELFIQFPIFRLWKNPPMKANKNPMRFLVLEAEE